MKVAITGGTGFVGRSVARRLVADGHEVVTIGRSAADRRSVLRGAIVRADITNVPALIDAFKGCVAVVHCAGINREIGNQTYRRVHVDGTCSVIEAAHKSGVERIVMLSFLRARPDGPTEYHRSKWAAEELVRGSDLTWTILKSGVIHGRGDHMLDHLSHAFYTFPIFGLVGLRDRPVRPVAVEDVARLIEAAATGDTRLADRTIEVLGPEELSLGAAVRRVAKVVGRVPIFVRLPIVAQLAIAHVAEWTMRVPLVSIAQIHILAEGVVTAAPFADEPPPDLKPCTPFSADVIEAGLPDPGRFSRADLRWSAR